MHKKTAELFEKDRHIIRDERFNELDINEMYLGGGVVIHPFFPI